jgi:hypothetical protein
VSTPNIVPEPGELHSKTVCKGRSNVTKERANNTQLARGDETDPIVLKKFVPSVSTLWTAME